MLQDVNVVYGLWGQQCDTLALRDAVCTAWQRTTRVWRSVIVYHTAEKTAALWNAHILELLAKYLHG